MIKDWAVVQALPNMERKTMLSAEALALHTYLPRYQDQRGRERIMFRGYVFAECRGDGAELFSLRGGRGPIMKANGEVAILPPGAIDQFRARESKFGYITFNERFENNQALIVVDGPYKNQIVLYRGMNAAQKELALFSLLGREVVKSFDRDELEALAVV